MNLKRSLAALGVVALVAAPAAATAKNSDSGGKGKSAGAKAGAKKGKKPKKPKTSTYEFKGLVATVGDGTLQVAVNHGNSRGKKFKGTTLTFDLSKAKLKVRDVNGDGKRDLTDVAAGDRVNVQAKLPRGAVDPTQTLPARHVVDKGPVAPPKPEDEGSSDDDGGEAPPAP